MNLSLWTKERTLTSGSSRLVKNLSQYWIPHLFFSVKQRLLDKHTNLHIKTTKHTRNTFIKLRRHWINPTFKPVFMTVFTILVCFLNQIPHFTFASPLLLADYLNLPKKRQNHWIRVAYLHSPNSNFIISNKNTVFYLSNTTTHFKLFLLFTDLLFIVQVY